MNRNELEILGYLAESKSRQSQRNIAEAIGKSVGTVNKLYSSLVEQNYIEKGFITDKGLQELEPYKVNRIIVIAAGFGSRLVPITLNTPKPLVRVKGQRIIDSLLDSIEEAGIEEIYIVRGYLGEQFDQLLSKYPNIKFIENKLFNEANNISSVFLARHLLNANTYIAEADLLVDNHSLIKRYQFAANYIGFHVAKTDDWCFETNGNLIKKVSIGGVDVEQMVGISYWPKSDAEKLAACVEEVWNMPGGKEKYWDQVPLEVKKKEFDVEVRPCKSNDVTEIDTFKELQNIDQSYLC